VLELLTILGIYNIKAFIRTFETLDTSYDCIILLYTSLQVRSWNVFPNRQMENADQLYFRYPNAYRNIEVHAWISRKAIAALSTFLSGHPIKRSDDSDLKFIFLDFIKRTNSALNQSDGLECINCTTLCNLEMHLTKSCVVFLDPSSINKLQAVSKETWLPIELRLLGILDIQH